MANTVGPLIKEARAKAKLSQESLASQIDGLSASDLGKAERGEKELSQSVLRQIAKLTGVTQSSLVNAAKESTYGPAKKTASSGKAGASASTAKKTETASAAKKTGTASSTKKTSTATSGKKTATASSTKKTGAASASAIELTAAEKKLVELYRAADSDTKKKAVAVLKGEQSDSSDILSALLGNAIDMFGKK